MSLLDQRDSVVVGRLRVKGTSVDQLADQRRASRLMRHADLHSRHVPAGGLLCVRTLRDPAPRVQPLGSDRVYLLPAWELAVNGQLDRHATEAARPLLGRVPSSAESVLFLDDAEVLACLAADWLSGTLARNWWWRQVLKSFDCGAVIDTWMRSIAAVPAAMELLHAWDMDERFVAQIPRTHADSLVRKMLRVHGVSSVEGRFSKVLPEAVADSQRTERGRASREPARNREEREPPWSPFVSLKEGTQLSGVGRQLIVQALMLRRAPDVARSSGFQRELSEYLAADALEESRGSQREPGAKWRGEPGGQRRKHSDLGGQKVESSATGNQAEEKRLAATRIEGRQGPSAHDRGDTAVKGEGKGLQESLIADGRKASAGNDGQNTEPDSDRPREIPTAEEADFAARAESTLTAGLLRTHTSFGGLFFLLNVGLALGFYADFFTPAAEPLDVNLWDFVAIFGERLTGGALRDDALWPLLAELAGRSEEEVPGSQNPWLLPPSEPWIDEVADRIAAFLREALHRKDAVELLCRQPASMTSTPTHIDVYFSMDTHPIEIRVACLDRDPGWIPAGGRYVAYHFD